MFLHLWFTLPFLNEWNQNNNKNLKKLAIKNINFVTHFVSDDLTLHITQYNKSNAFIIFQFLLDE